MHGSDNVITSYSSPFPPLSYFALLDLWWFTYKVKIYFLRISVVPGKTFIKGDEMKRSEHCQHAETRSKQC